MTRHNLDDDTKKIIRAVLHQEEKRARRQAQGKDTKFDRMAAVAIDRAKDELVLSGYTEEARKDMIQKIMTSLQYHTPWELMGDVLCGRRLFYEYRMEFCWIVAKHLGLVEDRSEKQERKR